MADGVGAGGRPGGAESDPLDRLFGWGPASGGTSAAGGGPADLPSPSDPLADLESDEWAADDTSEAISSDLSGQRRIGVEFDQDGGYFEPAIEQSIMILGLHQPLLPPVADGRAA